jgi:uncharacterized membrane protein YphA (DoxX/SURF4 family)
MKKSTTILYWIFTGLLAALMFMSAVQSIMQTHDSVDLISTQLRYPDYMVPFLGWAKLLGAIAILIPGFPRIKEWAYAGLAFDLIGATYSAMAAGNSHGKWVFMFIFFVPLIGSYIFYHKKLKEQSIIN